MDDEDDEDEAYGERKNPFIELKCGFSMSQHKNIPKEAPSHRLAVKC